MRSPRALDTTVTTANLPTTAESATTIDDALICEACQHPVDAHDALGLRFCAATVAAELSRGCICR